MALYEWNCQCQLLHLKLDEHEATFSDEFLLKRLLLQALTHPKAPVLLIDELDCADEEFEAFLLEILSEWQITIPEIGSINAEPPPTNNISPSGAGTIASCSSSTALALPETTQPFPRTPVRTPALSSPHLSTHSNLPHQYQFSASRPSRPSRSSSSSRRSEREESVSRWSSRTRRRRTFGPLRP